MSFDCKICNKQYKSNKTLQNHINKFHKDSDTEPTIVETPDISNPNNEETTQDIENPDEISDNDSEYSDLIQEIMEDKSGESTLYNIIVKILGDRIINHKQTKKIENTFKFVDSVESSFMNVVLEEAGITEVDLTLFTPVTPPIHPNHMGSAIGSYIKFLRHKLAHPK